MRTISVWIVWASSRSKVRAGGRRRRVRGVWQPHRGSFTVLHVRDGQVRWVHAPYGGVHEVAAQRKSLCGGGVRRLWASSLQAVYLPFLHGSLGARVPEQWTRNLVGNTAAYATTFGPSSGTSAPCFDASDDRG